MMVDPTLQLNQKGEVVRMVSEGEIPKMEQIMKVRDSKGNPVKESDPNFDYYANIRRRIGQGICKTASC